MFRQVRASEIADILAFCRQSQPDTEPGQCFMILDVFFKCQSRRCERPHRLAHLADIPIGFNMSILIYI